MWSSKGFLERCEKLKEAGIELQLGPGKRIARGFADLGFEEFFSLSAGKMVSVYTGQLGELPVEHHKFFFSVLDADAIVDAIVRHGCDIVSFKFENQRSWKLNIVREVTKREKVLEHREMLSCLADGLLEAMRRE